jgi:hypothetical protein
MHHEISRLSSLLARASKCAIIAAVAVCTAAAAAPLRPNERRHKIENFFCRIKDWRRIATRYDKLARNFLAATMLIGALYWIKL